MNLNDLVLRKAGEWKPAGNERQLLLIPDEGSGWTVTLTAGRNDELGCLVWELALRRSQPAEGVDLAGWAAQAAGRVTGLLDPLKVIEVDPERQEALLRSNQPTRRGQAACYYEVLLRGTREALLRRYQGFPDEIKRREQIAFPLTHEGLARVVSTLAGVP